MRRYQYHDVNYRGRIERVEYTTQTEDGEKVGKYVNVYLPYGYDPADKEKKYNILYLMHGGAGNADAWLDCCKIKNMLDYTFLEEGVEPFLVAFPSFYKKPIVHTGKPDTDAECRHARLFMKELGEEVLPLIERKYNVFAETADPEGLKASRDHRGFGGFSMGAGNTWFTFLQHLQYFRTFVPLSGDCWELEAMGGKTRSMETAECLRNAVLKQGYTADDFHIYAATGTEDIAYEPLTSQIEAMKKLDDIFRFSETFGEGNLNYFVEEKEIHAYETVYQYLYNYMPYLFR